MLLAVLNHLLAIFAIAVAIRFGGRPERIGGIVIATMILISDSRLIINYMTFRSVDYVSLTGDLFGFIGFSAVGILYKRIWPLWAAALQLLSVGAHFVRALEIPVRPIVYAWMKGGPTWAVYILLIVGTFLNCRRKLSQDSAHYSAN